MRTRIGVVPDKHHIAARADRFIANPMEPEDHSGPSFSVARVMRSGAFRRWQAQLLMRYPSRPRTPVFRPSSAQGLAEALVRLLPKIAVASLGIVLAVASTATGSAAATGVTLVPSVSRGPQGEGAIVTNTFNFTGNEYYGHPQPLRRLTVHLPAGFGGSATGFVTCDRGTLGTSGPTRCPPGSRAGLGSITTYVAFGAERVEERGSVEAFVGPSDTLNFYGEGHTPVQFEFAMTAAYAPDTPPFGRVLNLEVPLIETVPGAPLASITSLTLAYGATRTEGGLPVSLVTLPQECPPGELAWAASAGFNDGTSAQFGGSSPCLAAIVPPPVVGQRQTVRVSAGTVTIRPRGSSAFVPVSGASSIPDGSEVDTTAGTVLISSATSTPRQTQSAEVHGGTFLLHQDRTGVTHLALSQLLSACPGSTHIGNGSVALSSRRAKRRTNASRHLWVAERGGRWSTTGRYVSTSVEGTRWLTLDECGASEVRVTRGRVRVRNLINNRVTVLNAGHSLRVAGPGSTRKGTGHR
jgi:hypothetical protein